MPSDYFEDDDELDMDRNALGQYKEKNPDPVPNPVREAIDQFQEQMEMENAQFEVDDSNKKDFRVAPDRLTAHLSMVHEHRGHRPIEVTGLFSEHLEFREQPFVRRTKMGKEEIVLDTSWVGSAVGYVVIINDSGSVITQNPTKEEVEENKRKIIVVNEAFEIHPKKFFVAQIREGATITLRGLEANIFYTITAFPR